MRRSRFEAIEIEILITLTLAVPAAIFLACGPEMATLLFVCSCSMKPIFLDDRFDGHKVTDGWKPEAGQVEGLDGKRCSAGGSAGPGRRTNQLVEHAAYVPY